MAENKVNVPEDSIVSDMIQKLPQGKIYEITRCFQERFMARGGAKFLEDCETGILAQAWGKQWSVGGLRGAGLVVMVGVLGIMLPPYGLESSCPTQTSNYFGCWEAGGDPKKSKKIKK